MVAAITLTPNHGPHDTVITVDGTGFANTEIISVNYDGSPATTVPPVVTSNGSGVFSCTIIAPTDAPGTYVVDATDVSLNTDDDNFLLDPPISLTPDTGPIGTTVTIDGTDFSASEDITLEFDGNPITSIDATSEIYDHIGDTNANQFPIGSDPAYANRLGTKITGAPAIDHSIQKVQINLKKTGLPTGTATLTVRDENDTIKASDTLDVATLTTDYAPYDFDLGSLILLKTDYHILIEYSGGDVSNFVLAYYALQFAPQAGFITSRYTTFYLEGTDGNTAMTFDSAPVPITTNGSGVFSCDIIIPSSSGGAQTVNAVDETGLEGNADFNVEAEITLTPDTGIVGDTITIAGIGFFAGDDITTEHDSNPITTVPPTPVVSGGGTFSATFDIPSTEAYPGGHDIVCFDEHTGQDGASFIINPSIILTPSDGIIGDTISVTGHAFAQGDIARIKVAGNLVVTNPVDPPISLPDYNFTCTFDIPSGSDGVTVIRADDQSGQFAVANLDIIRGEGGVNATFLHLNGSDLRKVSLNQIPGRERLAIVDIPFSADDKYETGGLPLKFSGVQRFKQVYLCKILNNPIGRNMSFIPASDNDADGGFLKIWKDNNVELDDNSTEISSKVIRVLIRGI